MDALDASSSNELHEIRAQVFLNHSLTRSPVA